MEEKSQVQPSATVKSGVSLERLAAEPRRRLNRIPLLVPLLGAFGLVATFYGFEKLLDRTALADRPMEMVVIGVVLLLVTGAAAQKL